MCNCKRKRKGAPAKGPKKTIVIDTGKSTDKKNKNKGRADMCPSCGTYYDVMLSDMCPYCGRFSSTTQYIDDVMIEIQKEIGEQINGESETEDE